GLGVWPLVTPDLEGAGLGVAGRGVAFTSSRLSSNSISSVPSLFSSEMPLSAGDSGLMPLSLGGPARSRFLILPNWTSFSLVGGGVFAKTPDLGAETPDFGVTPDFGAVTPDFDGDTPDFGFAGVVFTSSAEISNGETPGGLVLGRNLCPDFSPA